MGEKALAYFGQMQSEGPEPDKVTFTCLLKVCGSLGSTGKGDQLHHQIFRQRLVGKDVMLDSALVGMYVKCGALEKAGSVLDELPNRDLASWNALISGYIHQGHSEKALNCFKQIQRDGLAPNAVTFTFILKAYANIGAVHEDEQLYNEIVHQGLLQKDVVLGTALVDMYAKCGALEKAAQTLFELPVRDVTTWSALISGYVQEGKAEKALEWFDQMQNEGCSPNAVTFISVLKACCTMGAVDKGEEIHKEILRMGLLEKHVVLCTTLVDMYAKCGELSKAASVVDKLPVRNTVTWNALISGYAQQGQVEEALTCFQQMQDEGISPDTVTLTCILKACGFNRAVDKAEQIHNEVLRQGLLGKNLIIGDALVDTYARCGALSKAAQVLKGLPGRNVVSWNSLIAGYIQTGENEEALRCFEAMQSEGIFPDLVTFVSILKGCGSLGAVHVGEQIHKDIVRHDLLGKDIELGNSLVDMYAKCGALAQAALVLDVLPLRNVVSWNALMTGYVQGGQIVDAFKCVTQMQHEGISPTAVTFNCLLKACGSMAEIDLGERIHKEIVQLGMLKETLLINSLVDMYAKCCAFAKAEKVLDVLDIRDVVPWCALIGGYALEGRGEEALKCFDRMLNEGLLPDTVTITCILKACSTIGAVNKGEKIYNEISRQGLLWENVLLGSALVDMYVKSGALAKATVVLEQLSVRNVVTWNTLISGYVQQGEAEEALSYYYQMQREGIAPDTTTYICVLKACATIGALCKGEQIHDEIVRKGLLAKDIVLGNTLVDMYAKCGALAKAADILVKLPLRDVITWNALMSGYLQQGKDEEVLKSFRKMHEEGILPDMVTFICTLKACAGTSASDKGGVIHNEIVRQDLLGEDVVLGNTLVDMYAKCGMLTKAAQVLAELPVHDAVSWNIMIAAYVKQGLCEDALKCFDKMQNEGFCLDSVTSACILKACGAIGAVDKGEEVHIEIVRQRLLGKDILLGNILIDMYAKCGALSRASQLLDELPIRNVMSWNVLMAGFLQEGQSKETLKCFQRMQNEGIYPNTVTAAYVLNACSRSGLLKDGQIHFGDMTITYGIEPHIEHYTCMVDLFSRVGSFDKALAVISKIPLSNDLPVWHAVLGACLKYDNVNVGRWAFENAMQVDRRHTSTYVIMSKIYSAAGMQEEAMNIEAMRQNWNCKLEQIGG